MLSLFLREIHQSLDGKTAETDDLSKVLRDSGGLILLLMQEIATPNKKNKNKRWE